MKPLYLLLVAVSASAVPLRHFAPIGSDANTADGARSLLIQRLRAESLRRFGTRDLDARSLRFDSLPSRAVPGVTYVWADYRPTTQLPSWILVTALRRASRLGIAGDAGAWLRVVGPWHPRTAAEASRACYERAVLESNNDPNRLLLRDEWRPSVVGYPYTGDNLKRVATILGTRPTVAALGADDRSWTVSAWYFDGGRAANPDRLAVRYRCTWRRGSRGRVSTITAVDSVMGSGLRRR